MKRQLVLLVTFALLLAACAVNAPGSTGVITQVDGTSVTVSGNGGQTTTYTLDRNTNIYSSDGVLTQRSYLSAGQRITVWGNGSSAVRINIEP